MESAVRFKKAAIIGVGLIGGSLAMVLRKKGLAGSIVGVGRSMNNLSSALKLGIVDEATQDVAEGVKGADLVVSAVPVLKIIETLKAALPHITPPCIVTDVGSVKREIIEEVEPLLPEGVHFVPAHPIAGTEHSGAEAAFDTLFTERVCILTPTENTAKEALEKVRLIWEAAGSKVVIMDPAIHDRTLAAVSHLPHMIAYTLVNTVADAGGRTADILNYSAGGFRDFTRIASSSPEMWTEICSMNRDYIVEMMENFQIRLEWLKNLISEGRAGEIREDFERAKRIRDSLVKKG